MGAHANTSRGPMSRRYRIRDRVFTVLCGFSRNEQGAVFIWMGAAVFALAAIGAFAVDMGYVYMLRAKLQTTADAAALAAASSLQDETQASDLALDLASANMSVAGHGNVLQGGDVRFGIWDQSTLTFQDGGSPVNAVQVVVRREGANGNSVPTFFANLMGVEEIDLSAESLSGPKTIWRGSSGIVCHMDCAGGNRQRMRPHNFWTAIRNGV